MVWGQPDEKPSGTFGLFSTICRFPWKAWLTDSGFDYITENWCLPLDKTWCAGDMNLFQLCCNRLSEWIPAKQHDWTPPQNVFTLSDLRHSFCSQQRPLAKRELILLMHIYICLSLADTALKRCSSTMNEWWARCSFPVWLSGSLCHNKS